MKNSCVHAVDELTEIRAHLARLRLRESELCDEIRYHATLRNADDVAGARAEARIETRQSHRIDVTRLPDSILRDPTMYEARREVVVLLWPKVMQESAPVHRHVEPLVEGVEADLEVDNIFANSFAHGPADTEQTDDKAVQNAPWAKVPPSQDAPAALKATAYTELPPLGTLGDEDLSTFLSDDIPLTPVADLEEVAAVRAMEADIDRRVDAALMARRHTHVAFASQRPTGTDA